MCDEQLDSEKFSLLCKKNKNFKNNLYICTVFDTYIYNMRISISNFDKFMKNNFDNLLNIIPWNNICLVDKLYLVKINASDGYPFSIYTYKNNFNICRIRINIEINGAFMCNLFIGYECWLPEYTILTIDDDVIDKIKVNNLLYIHIFNSGNDKYLIPLLDYLFFKTSYSISIYLHKKIDNPDYEIIKINDSEKNFFKNIYTSYTNNIFRLSGKKVFFAKNARNNS